MTKRYVSILVFSLGGALVLTQFQNCAPAHTASASTATGGDGGQARVIDDLASADLRFATARVELRDVATEASVNGLCNSDHDGAALKWVITDDDRRPMVTGSGQCAGGQFTIQIAGLDDMTCGVAHPLIVEGDWGGAAVTQFTRRCQPLASEPIVASDAPAGTSCELEYKPSASAGATCLQVCYRLDQVMNVTGVDAARCRAMASTLAGP